MKGSSPPLPPHLNDDAFNAAGITVMGNQSFDAVRDIRRQTFQHDIEMLRALEGLDQCQTAEVVTILCISRGTAKRTAIIAQVAQANQETKCEIKEIVAAHRHPFN